MPKHKIIIVSRSTIYHSGSGGMETHLRTLAEGLTKAGQKVMVITTSHQEGMKNQKVSNVNYEFLMDTTPGEYSDEFFEKSAERVDELVSTQGFEVVLGESIGASGYAKKENRTVPVIEIAHGSLRSEVLTKLENSSSIMDYLKFGLKVVPYAALNFVNDFVVTHKDDLIICVSEKVATEVMRDCMINKSKVRVVYNGVDPQFFKKSALDRKKLRNELGIPVDHIVLGSLGRVIKQKGYQDVLNIMNDLSENTHYLIVGEGDYLTELQNIASTQGISNRVHFVGLVDYSETPKYYSAMDVFLFPTKRREGFPMTLVEAQMCGLPVITADLGGCREAISVNKTGYLIESGNLGELTRKIKRMISGNNFIQISNQARLVASNKFSDEQMTRKTMDVISEAIKAYEQ